MINEQSEKYIAARESLPSELQPAYKQLVADYAFFSTKHFGRAYAAYRVLADLVASGWRPTEPAAQIHDDSDQE